MILLPRDTRMGELGEGVSNLSGAAGTGLGYLIASKVAQVRARNAFESFGMDKQQADALSRLPMKQRNNMLNDLAVRKGYKEAAGPTFGQAISQTSPQTQQRFAALAAMNAIPQQQQMQPMQATQAQPITSPMLQAQQGAQIPLQQAQAQMAMGGPRGMLQGADQGLQALQQARQQGLLGYQPQQQAQQPAQVTTQPPRQPGEAPRPIVQPGQAPVLPSEGYIPGLRQALRQPFAQPQGMQGEIPIEYQGLGLIPYQGKLGITGPKLTPEKRAEAEKDWYERQIKLKKDISLKQKDKLKKIYNEADEADKVLDVLKQLREVNKTGQVTDRSGLRIFGARIGGTQETKQAEDLLRGLPDEIKAQLSISQNATQRAKKINEFINKYETAQAKRNVLEELIDENYGWVPENINKKIEARIKEKAASNREQLEQQQKQIEEPISEKYAYPEQTNYIAQALAPVARAGELILGIPGNVQEFAMGPQKSNAEIMQEMTKTFEKQGVSQEPAIQRFMQAAQQNPQAFGGARLPTTQNLRETTRSLTGQTFEPTGYLSELYQDVMSKAMTMALPGSQLTFLRALIGATSGVAAREALKGVGVGPASQAIGEFLVTAGASSGQFKDALLNKRQQLYTAADAALPQATLQAKEVATPALYRKVQQVYNEIADRSMEGKDWLIDRIAEIDPIIRQPKISVKEIWDIKKDFNSWYDKVPNGVRNQFGKLKDIFKQELDQYSVQMPQFGRPYQEAEALSRAISDAEKVRETIEKSKQLTNLSKVWGIGGITRGVRTLLEPGSELYALLSRNPTARQVYASFYKQALAGNVTTAVQSMKKLNRILEEQQKKLSEY